MGSIHSQDIARAFLRSAQSTEGAHTNNPAILDWIRTLNEQTYSQIRKIPFTSLQGWQINGDFHSLAHHSGKFFSIQGYRIRSSWDQRKQWDQPLINQSEIGYLGFLVKEFEGVLHFLVQAKIEPGNSNVVQLSPTLQATLSNYTQVHGGKKPHYLEYFQNARPEQVLLDQLQSEQGSRFLGKRNRNIIVKVIEKIPVLDNFRWVTLGQLKLLMAYDNLLNMNSRTVIAGIHYGDFSDEFSGDDTSPFVKSALTANQAHQSYEQIISSITHQKSVHNISRQLIPLADMLEWNITENSIQHTGGAYFKVIAVDVAIEGREVHQWTQPMLEPASPGLCALIGKELNGLLHFAFEIKSEAGTYDQFELAPTAQLLEGFDKNEQSLDSNPFAEFVNSLPKTEFYFDAIQAEEGGRFYCDDNRNCIILVDESFPAELPPQFLWLTLHQVFNLMRFNNVFNIQARSLIAAIRFDS